MEHQGAQNTTRSHHHHHNGSSSASAAAASGGGGGGREDCWSEGATAVLIEAWGDRYLQLSRGNLRQKDWKDVADAVNGRADGTKPRRTDIQCKNRIDTIKKKYKLEKSKPVPSQWPFYGRLDHLIGTAGTPGSSNKKMMTTATTQPAQSLPFYKPPPPPVTFTVNKHLHHGKGKFYNPNPNLNHSAAAAAVYSGGSSSKSRLNSPGSTESSGGVGGAAGADDDDDEDDEDEEEIEDDEILFRRGGDGNGRKHRMDREVSNGTAFRELAKAVLKFGEIYERIENSKQQQMMELERQRMEFTKDLEFQRMQMFMDAQLELEKMKRPKHASTAEANAWLFLT